MKTIVRRTIIRIKNISRTELILFVLCVILSYFVNDLNRSNTIYEESLNILNAELETAIIKTEKLDSIVQNIQSKEYIMDMLTYNLQREYDNLINHNQLSSIN